ncbi:MAG: DHH family phosphoesterase [Bacteroidales bacterium]|nr:DHH family phosphoesterase [Bacteroidales bacterium]
MEFAREDILRLEAFLEASERPCILSHPRPDGDAAGSALALASYLASRGKAAKVLLPDPLPENLRFFEGADRIIVAAKTPEAARKALEESDLLLCVDFNCLARLETLEQPVRACPAPRVLIDHHLAPERESFSLVFSETQVSSASELLFWLLKALPGVSGDAGKLPAACRTALLTGMTTDTNNFANSVFPSTFAMASELIASGVDRDFVLDRLYRDFREERVRAMSEILLQALEITPDGAAFFIISEELWQRYGLREGELEGLVNVPLSIGKVRLSASLKETPDGVWRVSLRSKKGVSANRIAREWFHGGGHEQASGGKLVIGEDIPSREEVPAYVRKALSTL